MKCRRWLLPLVVGLMLGACDQEGPTAVGGAFVPAKIETFEIFLPAALFLDLDTTVQGLARPAQAGFTVVAREFEGELDANTLIRLGEPPSAVAWSDEEDVQHTETDPRYVGGELRIVIDTVRTDVRLGAEFQVQAITEGWDPISASWAFRIDTAGVREPWSQPGGTVAPDVNRGELEPEAESLVVALDSATVARWIDMEGALRGARISMVTPGERVIVTSAELTLKVRPEERPDTLVDASVGVLASTFVYDPAQPVPAADELRVGGLPSWRSVVQLRPRLDTLLVPCPADGGGLIQNCMRLADAQVNIAELMLTPLDVPAHFLPLDTLQLEARGALAAPGVPPGRAPLGPRVNPVNPPVEPERFLESPPSPVALGLTQVVARHTRRFGELTPEELPPRLLVLMAPPETGVFGFAAFGGTGAGDRELMVRLVLTRGEELGIR